MEDLHNCSSVHNRVPLCMLQLLLSSNSKQIYTKGPMETDHLKGLARQINFEDILQLKNFAMCVLSVSCVMRVSEVWELRCSDIKLESDQLSEIAKNKIE